MIAVLDYFSVTVTVTWDFFINFGRSGHLARLKNSTCVPRNERNELLNYFPSSMEAN